MMNIGFVGVGKLGLSCAEIVAEKHKVLGYDIAKRAPENFSMANTLDEVCEFAEIIFIAVPTPHSEDYDGRKPTSMKEPKDFDYTSVISAAQTISALVDENTLVVLISTVLPGTCKSHLLGLFPSGNFLYNPYLIAMGTVKWDMVNPEMIMIGCQSLKEKKYVEKLKSFYDSFMENNPRYEIGTIEEIECLKVFYNTFISAKVSLVNMVQDVAEKLGNVNSEFVCDALAACDRRIMGKSYMKPGMGDGGACHPRDNIALRWMANELNLGYDLFGSVMLSREVQAKNMAEFLCSHGLPVVIVGKAYKPMVNYLDGSSSILVGTYVENMGVDLKYYDPLCGETPDIKGAHCFLLAHDPEVTYGKQLDLVRKFHASHTINEADTAFLHEAAQKYTPVSFPSGSVIVDPWRKTPPIPSCSVIHYGNTRNRS